MATNDNGTILVEFDFEPQTGLQEAGLSFIPKSPEELAEKSAAALDKAMETTQAMAGRLSETASKLREQKLVEGPDGIEMAFGIKLDAEAGALLSKAGLEASISVKLSWSRTEKPMAVLPQPTPPAGTG
ncbi:MAG: hypothetical protein EP301_04340 [Gammaproteobacteria bacterium]|nr:MAG: hypothetical protein EP301_04340 [Gammaproteobacteria bacterium]